MATFELTTFIAAPLERCFDLSLDLDFHQRSFAHTGERIVGGRPSGRIGLHEFVTWEARHFGVAQRMSVGITAVARPHHFEDRMIHGPFSGFHHVHAFEAVPGGTRMTDRFEFRSPLGPLGALVDALFLKRYLRRLMETRNTALKTEAERGGAA
jgi:ligand-binding SRPBCC domain-containing protein